MVVIISVILEELKLKKVYFQVTLQLHQYVNKDFEFLQMNKIRYLVCCNAKELQEIPANLKIKDLAWKDNDTEKIKNIFIEIIPLVKATLKQSEKNFSSTLIFCNNGQNRSLCVVVCLLMERFNWSFYKALQYLDSKRSNLEISKNFFSTLKNVCQEFEEQNMVSINWQDQFFSSNQNRDEEFLLRNTFLNTSKLFQEKKFQKYNHKKSDSVKAKFFKTSETFSSSKKKKAKSIKKSTKSLGRKIIRKRIQWQDKMISKEEFSNSKQNPQRKEIVSKLVQNKILEKYLKQGIRAKISRVSKNIQIPSKDNFIKDFKNYQQKQLFTLKEDSHKNISKISTNIQEDSLNVENIKNQIVRTEEHHKTHEERENPLKQLDLISERQKESEILAPYILKNQMLIQQKNKFQKNNIVHKKSKQLFTEKFHRKIDQLLGQQNKSKDNTQITEDSKMTQVKKSNQSFSKEKFNQVQRAKLLTFIEQKQDQLKGFSLKYRQNSIMYNSNGDNEKQKLIEPTKQKFSKLNPQRPLSVPNKEDTEQKVSKMTFFAKNKIQGLKSSQFKANNFKQFQVYLIKDIYFFITLLFILYLQKKFIFVEIIQNFNCFQKSFQIRTFFEQKNKHHFWVQILQPSFEKIFFLQKIIIVKFLFPLISLKCCFDIMRIQIIIKRGIIFSNYIAGLIPNSSQNTQTTFILKK